MARELVVDELVAESQRRTGLQRFDSETFREGLGILVADINRDERPEPLVERVREVLLKALIDRLKSTAYLEGRPELLQRRSEERRVGKEC